MMAMTIRCLEGGLESRAVRFPIPVQSYRRHPMYSPMGAFDE